MKTSDLQPNILVAFNEYREHKLTKLQEEFYELESLLKLCESPLEQLLLLEFAECFEAWPAGSPEDRHIRGRIIFPNVDKFTIAIRQQHVISTQRKDYRADFVVTVEDWLWDAGRHEQLIKIVVEVDGHAFHEKTKEQAQSDKARDRSMTTSGYRVEIHR
jgi:hypothetical protein